jgi:hypothetical protein
MTEPLTIKFTRTGGGMPHLEAVVRDAVLSADDEHAWLGTERPLSSRHHSHDAHSPLRYRFEFLGNSWQFAGCDRRDAASSVVQIRPVFTTTCVHRRARSRSPNRRRISDARH